MNEPHTGMDFERSERQSLYKIAVNYNELMSEIEDADGVLTDEQIKSLEITEKQLKSKSIAYLSVIKGKEAVNNQIDEEIKRLQKMKKKNINILDRLKENLLNAVKTFGVFEVGLNKFGIRKSYAVEVLDVNSLPKEFKTIKVMESANKLEIKKAIKGGEKIEGCTLEEKQNLKIN